MNTPQQDDKDDKAAAKDPAPPAQGKPADAPAGNESNNPVGDANDVGAAGDYSR